jgi:hypothetical protein
MKSKKTPLRLRTGIILVLLGLLALTLGFFMGRSPALILGDAGFDALYGQRRIFFRQAVLSLRLFRRVKRVTMAENSGPEAVVFAVEEGAAEPWAVLGHARYRQGLERYAQQHPAVRTSIILEDPIPNPEARPKPGDSGLEFVFIDTRLSSWRAGRCAALLAGEGPGRVLVFQDRQDFPVNQEAFLAGLGEENKGLIPLFLNGSADYPFWEEVRCVVLGGPADPYFNRNSGIPALLFTWMDPALSPYTVKITGDDSPWALAWELFCLPAGEDSGGFRGVPVAFTVLSRRIGEGEFGKKLKKTAQFQIPASLSW